MGWGRGMELTARRAACTRFSGFSLQVKKMDGFFGKSSGGWLFVNCACCHFCTYRHFFRHALHQQARGGLSTRWVLLLSLFGGPNNERPWVGAATVEGLVYLSIVSLPRSVVLFYFCFPQPGLVVYYLILFSYSIYI